MTPSNQTLILAGERAPARANDAVGSNAVLQRVTVLATRPDDTLVYVRADYASELEYVAGSAISPRAPSTDSSNGSSSTQAPMTDARGGAVLPSYGRDVFGNPRTANRGVEQYAHTQRILTANQDPRYVDVLA